MTAQEEIDKVKADTELGQEYKVKYKAIRRIGNIDEHGQEHVLWLREPSRLAVGIFMATVPEDVVAACEYIFNDACIQEVSDVAYFQQNAVFYGILRDLQRLVSVKKSSSMTL